MKHKNKSHNGIISLWKFIFSVIIVLYHTKVGPYSKGYTLCRYGYIGVEFFFIVSGFLFARGIENNYSKVKEKDIGKTTIKFIFNKFKSFFPYVLFSYILGLIVFVIFNNYTFDRIVSSIWDLLLLRMFGFEALYLNTPIWYISALLISMFVLFPILLKYKDKYSYLIAPLIVLFGLGYLMQIKDIGLNYTGQWNGYIFLGLLRGFIEINIGIILYHIHVYLKEVKYTKCGKILLTIAELFCFISTIITVIFIKNSYRYDFILLLLLSIGILIAFSEKTYDYKICCNKFFFFLEKYCLCIYMCQWSVRKVVFSLPSLSNLSYYKITLVYISAVFLVGLLMHFVIELLKRKKIILKLKKIIVESD